MPGVARIVCRGRSGLYVIGRDNRLRLLDEAGKERWSCELDGVLDLPTNGVNPFRETTEPGAFFLLDASGTIWCLEET